MAKLEFDIEWEVEDGYAAGRQPHYCGVDDGVLDDEMTDGELEELYNDIVMEVIENPDFTRAFSSSCTEFVQWARAAMKAFKEEDNE